MIALIIVLANLEAQNKIIVDADGKGNFTTIQEALNSLSDSSGTARTIFIKKGTYKEKIFITKHNVVLEGEDRDQTIITYDIARDEWRCDHPDDWGVATMNVNSNDITLKNLTIANDYGFNVKESRIIDCKNDTITHKKTITSGGHQMALRTMQTTRLKAINCHFRAYAGDTVSPWNVVNGMFYFKDCLMEGGVDFYCPRGWAWAENCRFYANTGPASIWHDGSGDPDQKTVLKNCSFDGYAGFKLGRYHREAQFFLVDCKFSDKMADTPIYRVPVNDIKWGERIYYYNCYRKGGKDFGWYANNLPASVNTKEITIDWLFRKKWNPLVN
ncbi:MAG TPA: pectinesterase family protein [Chitinophagaceae bacterium]|nr:pectinesterase family protein [Chitinophagaceae bacterium]